MSKKTLFYPLVMVNMNLPWESVTPLGTPIFFPAKTVITAHSSGFGKKPGLYYIKKGKVRLSNVSLDGHEKMLLYMGEGTLFNEIPMLTATSDYMFTCVENTNAVFWTSEQITTGFIREYPDLLLNLLEAMGAKMQNFYAQLCGMSSYGSFLNVCRVLYIMYLFQRDKSGVVVPGISKQELSAFLGIHRSSLHKALARLQGEGVIGAYTRACLEVIDAEALCKYAKELATP